jgi:hypothetical protein
VAIPAAAAVKTVATKSGAAQVTPKLQSDKEQQIMLLLILAGVIIFVQKQRSGKGQDGVQYAALGVVGFVLLMLANFWPDVAFLFTLLFVTAVILNSPKGIPFISAGTPTGPTGQPLQPGQTGYGVVAPGHQITASGKIVNQ